MTLTPKKPAMRPPIVTLFGDAGTGKSSLAASFPKPIFLRAEDGLGRIHAAIDMPDTFPVIKTEEDLGDQLRWVLHEKHDYKTLVIDSVSALEVIFTDAILAQDGRAKTLATALGGYGAGIAALASRHRGLRKACGNISESRGMAIVFIGHADLETMRLPDSDDFQRYSLQLNNKSIPAYVADVDMVGFIRLVSALKGDDGDRKKVVSNGDRELVCYATAANVSKNGYGIVEPLDLVPGENPLMPFIRAKAGKTKTKKAAPVDPDDAPEPDYDNDNATVDMAEVED